MSWTAHSNLFPTSTSGPVSINDSGQAVHAWSDGSSVYASVFDGTDWSAPSTIYSGSTVTARSVKVLADGSAVVFFTRIVSGYLQLGTAVYSNGSWGTPSLRTGDRYTRSADLVEMANGSLGLAFINNNYYARFVSIDPSTGAMTAPVGLEYSGNPTEISSSVNPVTGEVVVTFNDYGASKIYAWRSIDNGATWDTATQVFSSVRYGYSDHMASGDIAFAITNTTSVQGATYESGAYSSPSLLTSSGALQGVAGPTALYLDPKSSPYAVATSTYSNGSWVKTTHTASLGSFPSARIASGDSDDASLFWIANGEIFTRDLDSASGAWGSIETISSPVLPAIGIDRSSLSVSPDGSQKVVVYTSNPDGSGTYTYALTFVGSAQAASTEVIAPNSSAFSTSTISAASYEIIDAPVQTPDALSDSYETLVGGALLRGETISGGTVYAALLSADPGEGSDMSSEVAAASYQRTPISFGPAATPGSFANDQDCFFPETTEAWGAVNYVAMMNAPSGGAMIMAMPLGSGVNVGAGEQLVLRSGALTITIS